MIIEEKTQDGGKAKGFCSFGCVGNSRHGGASLWQYRLGQPLLDPDLVSIQRLGCVGKTAVADVAERWGR